MMCSQWACDMVTHLSFSGIYLLPKGQSSNLDPLKSCCCDLRHAPYDADLTPSGQTQDLNSSTLSELQAKRWYTPWKPMPNSWTFNGTHSISAAARVWGWLRLDTFLGRMLKREKPLRVSVRECPRSPERIAGPDVFAFKQRLFRYDGWAQREDQG